MLEIAGHLKALGRFSAGLAAAWLLCPALALANDPAALPARIPAASTVRARIVLQQLSAGGPNAAWSKNDRFIAVHSGLGNAVQVWSASTGDLINVIPLPAFDPKALLEVWQVSLGADNRFTIQANIRETDMALCTPVTLSISIAQAGEWQMKRGEAGGPCLNSGTEVTEIRSHDGKLAYLPEFPAKLVDRRDEVLMWLAKPEPVVTFGAALSPDGTRFALLSDSSVDAGTRRSRIAVFDLATSRIASEVELDGYYVDLHWLDNDRIIAPGRVPGGRYNPSDIPDSQTRIIAVSSGAQQVIPLRCDTVALPDGALIGSGLGNCSYQQVKGQGLERHDPQTGWQPFGPQAFAGSLIDQIALSPDGRILAVVTSGEHAAIQAIDARSGAVLAETSLPGGTSDLALSFTPDSKALGLRKDLVNYSWNLDAAPPVALSETDLPATMLARETASADGQTWYERFTDFSDGPIAAVSTVDGKRSARLVFAQIMAEGPVPGTDLRWVVTGSDGLVLWQPRRGGIFGDPEVVRTNLFPKGGMIALTPEGRYDTNLGADAEQLRWLVSDAPLQSLAASTFMRNFFEPRLLPRLVECHRTDSCAAAFRPVGALAQLNRALPQVKIVRISQGTGPGQALVDVELHPGRLPDAPNGKTVSQGYDLRLFREGSLVAQWPGDDGGTDGQDLAAWRKANLVPVGANGAARHRFAVNVPAGSAVLKFSAYAFNEDRVKSETALEPYARRPVVTARPRVFVIALGVDDYRQERLRLSFAAGDARLIGQRLAALPGAPDVRLLVVADDDRPDSPQLTRAAVGEIFGLLGGAPRGPALARLMALGIDAAMLDRAGPDDTVLISFSGHGWADPQGSFYLLPADARWPDPTRPPDLASLVSTADLARLLRRIDAGELALIIDACHSAASIDSKGFRAGPMGDAGLGQLAFDKRMRILAATQGDDVAQESALLGQGLLTYALADEGITADGGAADENGNGEITLDEWLRYAVRRLPALSRDPRRALQSGQTSGARGVVFLDGPQAHRAVQEPALFDFTGEKSKLVLRKVPQ